MPRRFRYTGRRPPPKVLAKIPNWVLALDEEGENGQDETTIKPDVVQDSIAETTSNTAADVTLPTGRKLPALLSSTVDLWKCEVEYLDVFDGKVTWQVELSHGSWAPSKWADDTKEYGDRETFPLQVTSRLTSVLDGQAIRLTLLPDGKINIPRPSASGGQSNALPYIPRDISAHTSLASGPPSLETADGGLNEEYKATVAEEVKKRGYFAVDLFTFPAIDCLSDFRKGKAIPRLNEQLDRSFMPLVRKADHCRIFHTGVIGKNHGWSRYVQQKGRSCFVDLTAEGIDRDYRFWWHRSNRVLAIPSESLDLKDLFSAVPSASLPSVVGNLGAIVPRSAITFATQASQRNDFICLIPTGYSTQLALQLFAPVSVALSALDAAFQRVRVAPEYRKHLARYWVRPFEQKAGIEFLFEAEQAKSAKRTTLLTDTLWRAVRNLSHAATAWRALAAAEIIAAAMGFPAPDYNPNRDRERSCDISYCVLRFAKRLGPLPDLVAELARDVVSLIADHSVLKREQWLTSEAQERWLATVAYLHVRLNEALRRLPRSNA